MRNIFLVLAIFAVAFISVFILQSVFGALFYLNGTSYSCDVGCVNNTAPNTGAAVKWSVNWTNSTSNLPSYWIFGSNWSGSFVNLTEVPFWQNQTNATNGTVGNGTTIANSSVALNANDNVFWNISSTFSTTSINSSILANPNFTSAAGGSNSWTNTTSGSCDTVTKNEWDAVKLLLNITCFGRNDAEVAIWTQAFVVNSSMINPVSVTLDFNHTLIKCTTCSSSTARPIAASIARTW